MTGSRELRFAALEVQQGPGRVLYSFAVDGKMLGEFTTVSRIRRETDRQILGYQRPEVLSHIAEIRRYVESENPMIPNAIVIAFDGRVKFEPLGVDPVGIGRTRVGTLIVPVHDGEGDEEKPGWIVDGQQRAAAVREARVAEFPLCVTAFIAEGDQEQKEQFILVNSTRPLPKGLVYELLPATTATLPSPLQRRRFPSYLLERLNFDENSPFCGLIQTTTNHRGIVKDNSVLKMLEHSLVEGALYAYRDPATGMGDTEAMLAVLKRFWGAVRYVFADAWGLSPRKSRLMHGAGIVAMGFVMDAVMDGYPPHGLPFEEEIRGVLNPMRPVCAWTRGTWEFGPGAQRRWDDVQNTPKDSMLLARFLLDRYHDVLRQRTYSARSA